MAKHKKRKNKKNNKNIKVTANKDISTIEELKKSDGEAIIENTPEISTENKIVDSEKTTKEEVNIFRTISVMLCQIVILAAFIIGFILPLRPSVSNIEQRDLEKFPTLSSMSLEEAIDDIISGNYFSKLGLWYSDSFPAREMMIGANNYIKSYYGIASNEKMVGTDIAADDIPVLEESRALLPEENQVSENEANNNLSENKVSKKNVRHDIFLASDENEVKTVELPSSTSMEEEIKQNIQQNLYVKDGAAYSKYYFALNSATKYIDALNLAASELEGKANVISILIPNQSGVMLPYDEMLSMGGSNQIEAIRYYYGSYENVDTVDTIESLRKHNGKYLYFRTDHHWTTLGAYYVYENFCKLKGFEAHDLSYFEKMTFDPFLGSFYSQLRDSNMAANPDYVDAYIPNGTNELTYWDVYGNRHDWYVISNVAKSGPYAGYYCFVGGDKPLARVINPNINDGSACLVIKESYANAFIPYLVDHYQYVYYMDCRYATENFVEFVINNNIDDLIFVNNITIIGSSGLCSRIYNLCDLNAVVSNSINFNNTDGIILHKDAVELQKSTSENSVSANGSKEKLVSDNAAN